MTWKFGSIGNLLCSVIHLCNMTEITKNNFSIIQIYYLYYFYYLKNIRFMYYF